MLDAGHLFVGLVTIGVLVAIGVSIPVLKQLVQDGLERHRELRAGERERFTEDPEYDRSNAIVEGDVGEPTRLPCRRCGAENDPEFTYCRRCAEPL